MTKPADGWDELFSRHSILEGIREKGRFEITSSLINKVRESRLMTKFDHRANLPDVLRKNSLSILPNSRGSYLVSDFDAYAAQAYDPKVESEFFDFPQGLESINPSNLFSESSALSCAYLTGMIDEIAGSETKPTVSGRMGTSIFDFKVRHVLSGERQNFHVENCQCEIDGGYEGDSALVLVEAKNAIAEDFIIRQLYYPYRLWRERVAKKVIPVFLSYSNDTFHFFVYRFDDPADYNSLKLVQQRNFTLSPERIELEDIQRVCEESESVPEPVAPFPQADRFERVVDLLNLVAGGVSDAMSITANYDFDSRQTEYYTGAAKYLGLLSGSRGYFALTNKGAGILKLRYKEKYLALAREILSHRAFNLVCKDYFANGERPKTDRIVEIMRGSGLRNVGSESTFKRRATTVLGWIEWIFGLQS